MRILFDQQVFSNQQVGGISRYFTELAKEFCNTDAVTAKIVSPLCTNHYVRAVPARCLIGVPVPGGLQTGKILRYANAKCARLIINRVRPDIIHQTYYPKSDPAYHPAPKSVTTVHDMIYELFPEKFPGRDQTAKYKRRALRAADHIICVSENTRAELIQLTGVRQSQTSVVYHGANHLQTAALPAIGTTARPFLLHVGERDSYKNFQCTLKAYAKTPGLMRDFDLLCFGGGRFRELEKQLAKRLHIPAENILSVQGSDQVLAGLYQHAALLICPSLYEGFGLPPLEAMTQGCAVISSNTSSLPEVLGAAAEYFDPANPDDLVRAIETVLNTPGRADELKRLGQQQAEKFTWQRCAEQTLQVYTKLLADTA